MSGIASRKRRRQSDVPSQSQPDSASALVKQALFTLNCEEGVNEDLFETAQESLSAAFKATRAAEKSLPPEAKPLAFDWHLPPETIIKLEYNLPLVSRVLSLILIHLATTTSRYIPSSSRVDISSRAWVLLFGPWVSRKAKMS